MRVAWSLAGALPGAGEQCLNRGGSGGSRARSPASGHKAFTSGPPGPSYPGTPETPNQLEASAPGDKIYRYIYIIKRSPKWGRGAGSLGPPSKPRLEEGLKSPKSSSQPCTHLPRAPPPPQLSVPSEHPLSAVLEFVVKGWAPFQRGPQGLEPLKGRQPARVPDRHPSFQPLQSQGG